MASNDPGTTVPLATEEELTKVVTTASEPSVTGEPAAANQGHDEVAKATTCGDDAALLPERGRTVCEAYWNSLAFFSAKPFLGVRVYRAGIGIDSQIEDETSSNNNDSGSGGNSNAHRVDCGGPGDDDAGCGDLNTVDYTWLTYGDVRRRSLRIASALSEKCGVRPHDLVSVCGRNSVDWVCVDLAFMHQGIVNVPLHVTTEPSTLEYILNNSHIDVVFCDASHLPVFLTIARGGDVSIRCIVVMDGGGGGGGDGGDDGSDPSGALARAGGSPPLVDSDKELCVFTLSELEEYGESCSTTAVPYYVRQQHQPPQRKAPSPETTTISSGPPLSTPMAVLYTVVYTSGSTGNPKGAMISDEHWHTFVAKPYLLPSPFVRLSFTPLAHVQERQLMGLSICYGGQVAICTPPPPLSPLPQRPTPTSGESLALSPSSSPSSAVSSVSSVFDEASLIRPTMFTAPPRVYNYLYHRYHDERTAMHKRHERLYVEHWQMYGGGEDDDDDSDSDMTDGDDDDGSDDDNSDDTEGDDDDHEDGGEYPVDSEASATFALLHRSVYGEYNDLQAKYRNILGDRLQYMVTGGALTSDAVLAFLRECFLCPVHDGYGATEVGGIYNNGWINSDVDYRMHDVPTLGYHASDLPFPRGEICVKTPTMFMGYHHNTGATSGAYTDDGYFRSGDIGVRYPDGRVQLIDRISNVLKLPQGEFVELDSLRKVYEHSSSVSQIYIHGDQLKEYLVAVVVVAAGDMPALTEPSSSTMTLQPPSSPSSSSSSVSPSSSSSSSSSSSISLTPTPTLVFEGLQAIATQHGLPSYKHIRAVHLTTREFTAENHQLTPSMKPCRRMIARAYANEIASMQAQVDKDRDVLLRRLTDMLGGLTDDAKNDGVGDGIQPSSTSADGTDNVIHLLGDSLHVLRVISHIREAYQVDIPLQMFFSTTVTLLDIARYVTANRNSAGGSAETLDPSTSEDRGDDPANVRVAPASTAAVESRVAVRSNCVDQTLVDTVIDDLSIEVAPTPSADRNGRTVVTGGAGRRVIFLTGATGFLGAFLLKELLERQNELRGDDRDDAARCVGGGDDDGGCLVVCLVRTEEHLSCDGFCCDDDGGGCGKCVSNVSGDGNRAIPRGSPVDLRTFECSHARARLRKCLQRWQLIDEPAPRGTDRIPHLGTDGRTDTRPGISYADFDRRVVALRGDFSLPGLGLDTRVWNALSMHGSEVFHCGARVNWLDNYAKCRVPNVLGTAETLRLCLSRSPPIPLHYVSTMGVAATLAPEGTLTSLWQLMGQGSGYSLSKWVSEALVRRVSASVNSAITDGGGGGGDVKAGTTERWPVSIHRPAMVCGHSESGVANRSDFVSRLLTSFLVRGVYIDDPRYFMDITPVDAVARCVVRCASRVVADCRTLRDGPTDFHIFNRRSMSYRDVGKLLSQLSSGSESEFSSPPSSSSSSSAAAAAAAGAAATPETSSPPPPSNIFNGVTYTQFRRELHNEVARDWERFSSDEPLAPLVGYFEMADPRWLHFPKEAYRDGNTSEICSVEAHAGSGCCADGSHDVTVIVGDDDDQDNGDGDGDGDGRHESSYCPPVDGRLLSRYARYLLRTDA